MSRRKTRDLLEEMEAWLDDQDHANSTVDDRGRRFDLSCSFCRPNKGENIKNPKKHGETKPKYKTRKKKR